MVNTIYRQLRHPIALILVCSALFIHPIRAYPEQLHSPDLQLDTSLTGLSNAHLNASGAYVLEKGEEALLTRAWLTDHAEHSVDIQYFIWSTDNIGTLAAESLLRAAERGVRVRVLVDDFLMDAPTQSMLALAAHPNISIKIYNPKNSVGVSTPERTRNILGNFRSFNQRMHDKTFMVDGLIGITGGRNMADEYFDYDHEYNFRDRDILLLGPVVGRMEESFQNFWECPLAAPVEEILAKASRRLTTKEIAAVYAELHRYAADPENFAPQVRMALRALSHEFPLLAKKVLWSDITFLSDLPGKNQSHGLNGGGRTTSALLQALRRARKQVVIQSPYLILPAGGLELFQILTGNGVEVKISTNSLASTDNLQAFSGYSKQRRNILESGIRVFEFRPQPAVQKELLERYAALEKNAPTFAIHAKTMVIDDELLYVGTFNLDPRSANLNTEVGVLIKDPILASQVRASMERDMRPENSWDAAVDDPDSYAPLGKRLKLPFWKLLPISPLL